MRNLEGSGWMTMPELSIIEATGAVKGLPYAFSLTVTLANPNAARDEDGDGVPDAVPPVGEAPSDGRSEEHTSELQSLMRISYAVFCLKKNTLHTSINIIL